MPTSLGRDAAARARVTPPELTDPSNYVKVGSVPILDTHVRRQLGPDGKARVTVVDEHQLRLLYENTARRLESGEIPQVLVGHTRRDGRETEQPPTVGFIGGLAMGEYNGKPAILADMYLEKQADLHELGVKPAEYTLKQFPRRSVELFRKLGEDGYIDALALLKRSPERPLGMVTYGNQEDIEVYECPCNSEGPDTMDSPTPASAPPAPPQGVSQQSTTAGGDPAKETAEAAAILKISQGISAHLIADEGLCVNLAKKIAAIIKSEDASGGGQSSPGSPAPSSPAPAPAAPASPEPETYQSGPDNLPTEEGHMSVNDENLTVELGVLKGRLEAAETENAALKSENAGFKTRLDQIEAYHAEQIKDQRTRARRAKVEAIVAKGYPVDADAHLERYAAADDALFDAVTEDIERYAVRSPAGAAPIQTVPMNAPTKAPARPGDIPEDNLYGEPGSTSPIEGKAVELYMSENADRCAPRENEDGSTRGLRVIRDYLAQGVEKRREYLKRVGVKV